METYTVTQKIQHVILDTTTLFSDLRFSREGTRRLLSLSAHDAVHVYIPEVVFREMCRHYKREALAKAKGFADGLSGLRRLGISLPEAPDAASVQGAADETAARYKNLLLDYLVEHGVAILPVPNVDHEKLLADDLAEKKPWRDGKGYRDALIWHSVLELLDQASPGDRFIFVTSNTRDFAGSSKGELADTLKEEVARFNGDVILLPDIDAVLKSVAPNEPFEYPPAQALRVEPAAVQPPTDRERSDGRQIVLDAVHGAIDKLVGSSIDDLLDERVSGIPFGDVDIPRELQNPALYSVDARIDDAQVDESEIYDDDLVLFHVAVPADVTIDGYAHKSDTYDDTLEIMVFDWNDHMSWVYVTREVRLIFSVLYTSDGSVESVEFSGAEAIVAHRSDVD